MKDYTPTIGLEIHAELRTETKMFCSCKNDPDEARPNQNVCPICLAHPGTLPTINKEAVHHVLRVGASIDGTLADFTEFDRKSYFYPDIPKGYQISQYEHPLISGGELRGVQLTRIHLEEDTARSIHVGRSTSNMSEGKSLVDFNRAGIPLMELVTEPVIHDAATAVAFARELQLLLRTLGASDANLEKGEMRIEANISVSTDDALGTKVEVKNLNSFRSVDRAIKYEIERQATALREGERIVQETRGWDEGKQSTFRQRVKEGSADYRYFPEPDLPKLILSELSEFSQATLRASLPELPWMRRERYAALGLSKEAVAYIGNDADRALFFDAVIAATENDMQLITLAANYFSTDIAGWLAKDDERTLHAITPANFILLMKMVRDEKVSSRGAKDVLVHLLEKGGDSETLAREQGLEQVHDEVALTAVVEAVLKAEDKAVAEYRAGKEAALQYLVGKAMKESKGAGNPSKLRELFEKSIRG